ncbi:MAG: fatty acid desaturase [Chloroherpetonaceae bacterium]|nr:fatty acid desaturase [Chloroherpetonaceae bacterium]
MLNHLSLIEVSKPISETANEISKSFPKKHLNRTNLYFFIITPLIGILGTFIWANSEFFNWSTVILAIVLWKIAGMSITAGYHRLFSHRSYDAKRPIELFFIFSGAMAFEGSVLEWSADHRIHHRFQDKDEDPYAIKKGFWYAHLGWIFKKNWEMNPAIVPDLSKDAVIRFQHKYYIAVASFMSFVFPMLIASLWLDPIGGLIVAGALRLSINHHLTFFINSLCHYIGTRPYSDIITARDSWFTALLTHGEGYHNFHHEFPGDYRNGIRFYHFDPTKWVIYLMNLLGLATRLNRMSPEKILQRRVAVQEREILQALTQKSPALATYANETLAAARKRILDAGEKLSELREEYYALKAKKNEEIHFRLEELKHQLSEAQRDFQINVAMWKAMIQGFSKACSI